MQQTNPEDTTPELGDNVINKIQGIVDFLLLYYQYINNTLLMTLIDLV